MFIASLLLRQDTTAEGAEVRTGWKRMEGKSGQLQKYLDIDISKMELQKYLDTDISKMETQKLGVVAIVTKLRVCICFSFSFWHFQVAKLHFAGPSRKRSHILSGEKENHWLKSILGVDICGKTMRIMEVEPLARITLQGNSFWRHPIFHLTRLWEEEEGFQKDDITHHSFPMKLLLLMVCKSSPASQAMGIFYRGS